MTTAWVRHDDYLMHDTGGSHPERPSRLTAVVDGLQEAGLADRLAALAPRPATVDEIAAIHDPGYIRQVEQACDRGDQRLDADTAVCAKSYRVALLAAGGVLAAADAVHAGVVQRAFCTVRPPGHHAERDRAMGFCLFNNVAIAAERFVRNGLQRVAIVDFDVHHGNGTQHAFERRADVLFISIHEDPRHLYPGTGFAHETGLGPGEGFTLNVPMMPGAADGEYQQAFEHQVLPKLDAYRPQMILISAGFDAARGDPLAHIELTDKAFEWMTRRLVELADRHCAGKLLSVLEGGYNPRNLARCAAAHVKALM
jgi:acetoin utilization deacetylase AcuC-like enzyme